MHSQIPVTFLVEFGVSIYQKVIENFFKLITFKNCDRYDASRSLLCKLNKLNYRTFNLKIPIFTCKIHYSWFQPSTVSVNHIMVFEVKIFI